MSRLSEARRTSIALATVAVVGLLGASAKAQTRAMQAPDFFSKAAMGRMSNLESARLTGQRSQDPAVRRFAQEVVDEHSRADEELKRLAGPRGWNLPTQLGPTELESRDRLSKLSGAEFDREYAAAILREHDETVALFESYAKDGRIPS